MAASAHVQYAWSEQQSIDIEVWCDEGFPDQLDQISRRAAWLLGECLVKVNTQVGVSEEGT